MIDFLKSLFESEEKSGVVKHRRNGSPYVNPNELFNRADPDALLGDVSESLDELENKKTEK